MLRGYDRRGYETRKDSTMRRYETLFIVIPDCSEEDLKSVAAKFQGVVNGMNGQLLSYDEQGKKKLAYTVKKQNKGYYVLMDYVGEADVPAEVERNMRLDDRVLKYITVKLADKVDPHKTVVKDSEPQEQEKPADLPEADEPESLQPAE
ncbi:MAG: 30S ribosomal protein S6 [Syntrophobacteria bacterium]